MGKLRWEDVGADDATKYIDQEKVQKICDEGWRLIQFYGSHDLHIRYGTPVMAVFEEIADAMVPVSKPPVVGTAPVDERIPAKRQSFADKVRAQQQADEKAEKRE